MNKNEKMKISVWVTTDPILIQALEKTAIRYKVDIDELIHMILYDYLDIE